MTRELAYMEYYYSQKLKGHAVAIISTCSKFKATFSCALHAIYSSISQWPT